MIRDSKEDATNLNWSFRWSFGETPVVRFKNPKAYTSVIYTVNELKTILDRTDRENDFIPVPRSIMQGALDTMKSQILMQVQGSMVA